jgi:DNA polymerase IV
VRMADSVAARLRRAGLAGRTVTLKVRYGDFTTRTRSRTHPHFLADGPTIAATGRDLLGELDVSPGIRLLGVGVSNLVAADRPPDEQLALDLGPADRPDRGSTEPAGTARPGSRIPPPRPPADWARAAGAVDAVRSRFGAAAVGPAALLGSDGIDVTPSDARWGPADGPG